MFKIQTNTKEANRLLLFLFIISFLIRGILILFSITNNAYLYPDSYDYIALSKSLSENFTFGHNAYEIFRAPLYPVFLAVISKITSHSYFIIITLFSQAFLDSITSVLIAKTYNNLFKAQKYIYPFAAGLMYAVSPLAAVAATHILSETLFNFFLIILFFLISNYKTEKISGIYIGFFMGLLVLTRNVFLPLSIAFIALLFLKTKSLKFLTASLLVCFTILLGWSIRNYIQTGYFGVSSVSSILLYRYNACALEANLNNKEFSHVQSEFDSSMLSMTTQKEQAEYALTKSIKLIMSHPFKYTLIHLKTSLNSLLPASGDFAKTFGVKIGDSGTLSIINTKGLIAGVKHYFASNSSLFILLLPLSILLLLEYILALIGVSGLLKNGDRIITILLFLSGLYFIFVGGPASTPRFRMPAEPIIFIFAAYGIYFTVRKIRKNAG